jgi:hypothetical protein
MKESRSLNFLDMGKNPQVCSPVNAKSARKAGSVRTRLVARFVVDWPQTRSTFPACPWGVLVVDAKESIERRAQIQS